MLLQAIIDRFRIEVFDNVAPYLFSDEVVTMLANDAEDEATIRSRLIRERLSVPLVQFDIVQGVLEYQIDRRLVEITYASLTFVGSNSMLPYVLPITTHEELDDIRPFWRTLPYRPTGIIHLDNKLTVDTKPNASYRINVEGYRLPMSQIGLTAVPEVLSSGTVTLTAGTTGQVSAVLVNGVDVLGSAISFITSLTLTAAAVVAQINTYQNRYVATNVGPIITLTDLPDTGSLHNGYTVSVTVTGDLTATATAFAGGIDKINTSPEINAIHHRHLVKWMVYRAYQIQDTETIDVGRAEKSYKDFVDVFGERPDANYRKRFNASRPHRVTAYW